MITKEELKNIYANDRISAKDIAKKFGVTRTWIYRLLARYDIKRNRRRGKKPTINITI